MNHLNELQQCIHDGTPYKPIMVKLKLLNNCNLKCRMCNHWKYASYFKKHHFYYPIIDELAALGCEKIHITGGEPLLYPKLNKLLKYIRDNYRQIRVSMTTNGTLVDESMAEMLVNCGVRTFSLSIDSPDPKIDDEMRGVEGAFSRTCKGIANLKNKERIPINICINTLVTPWNYKTLSDIPRLANELGANEINFIPLHVHNQNSCLLDPEQIRDYSETIIPAILSEATKYSYNVSREDLIEEEHDLNNVYLHQPCIALWTHLVIDHCGKVFPCCVLREKELGILSKNTITEIWNGEAYQRLRQCKELPIHQDCLRCKMFLKKQMRIMQFFGD